MYINYFTRENAEKFQEIITAVQSLREALKTGVQEDVLMSLTSFRRVYRASGSPITARPLYLVGVENNGVDKQMTELFPVILKRYEDDPDREMSHEDVIHFTHMCPILQKVESFPSKWDREGVLRVISNPHTMNMDESRASLERLSGPYWETFYEALSAEGDNDRLIEILAELSEKYVNDEDSKGFISYIALERSDGYFIRIIPGSIIKVNLKSEEGEIIDLFEDDGSLNKDFKEFILSKFPTIN